MVCIEYSIVPEIWLNYGITDVVLDIRAENLEQKINSEGTTIEDLAINEKLTSIDLSKPMDLMVLHNSRSIQKLSLRYLQYVNKNHFHFLMYYLRKKL